MTALNGQKRKILTLSSLYHPPTILKYVFSIFVAIEIAVFCAQLVPFTTFYIYKEVSGVFSGIAAVLQRY